MARAIVTESADAGPGTTKPLPRSSAKPKRASALADQIEADIVDAGWPIGEILGSEPDLIERYKVSRAVFREAVRLLEQREVTEMRRGPGGGLIVTAPEFSVVRRAASTLLRYEQVDVAEMIEARVATELACLQLAVERLDENGVQFLRGLLADEEAMIANEGSTTDLRNFHVELATLSGNRPMDLFVSILTDLQAEFSPYAITSRSPEPRALSVTDARLSHRAHRAIVEAMVVGDVGIAMHRMRRHLAGVARFSSEYAHQPH